MARGLRNKARTETARPEAEVVPLNPAEAAPSTVGELLRERRKSADADLREAADYLRIRCAYLQAIEEDRVDDLPGATYAMGFVRAYADYLGLDGPAVVERYKNEMSELGDDVRLVFPSPSPEGKIPSAAIILVGVLSLILTYGGWVFLAQPDTKVAELIPSLPDSFLSFLGTDEAPVSDNAVTTSSDVAPTVPQETAPSAVKTPETETANATKTETIPSEGNAGSVAATAASTIETTSTDIPALISAVAARDDPANTNETSALSEEATATAVEEVTAASAPETAPPDETTLPPPPPAVASAEPRQFGSDNANGRVVVKARVDSWVEIRGPDGTLLLTRVLRAGDSYRVPDQSGLLMLTGNAGGLEISVDGSVIPDLGPEGSVRRNVAMDAESLKAYDGRR